MSVRVTGESWQFSFRYEGREYSGDTGLPASEENRSDAEQFEAEMRVRLAGGLGRAVPACPMLFGAGVEQFLQWAQFEYSEHPHTFKRMCTSFTSLLPFFEGKLLHKIEAIELENFKLHRFQQGVKKVTVRHDLHNLSKLFQYGITHRWCFTNTVREVKVPSDRDAIRINVVSEETEAKYFTAAKYNPTLYDLARMMVLTGMRPSEVLALRTQDFNERRRSITIRKGKSRAARRTLKLIGETLDIVKRRTTDREPEAFLFPGKQADSARTKLNNDHARALKRAGVKFCLYDLRHTFATRMASQGMSVATLAAILGHSDVRTLSRYVHPSQPDMDTAMERFADQNPGYRGKVGKGKALAAVQPGRATTPPPSLAPTLGTSARIVREVFELLAKYGIVPEPRMAGAAGD